MLPQLTLPILFSLNQHFVGLVFYTLTSGNVDLNFAYMIYFLALYFCAVPLLLGFPRGSYSKESDFNAGDPSLIPESGRSPREGNGYPLLEFLPGEFHRQKSLVGYCPWGHIELDMTE